MKTTLRVSLLLCLSLSLVAVAATVAAQVTVATSPGLSFHRPSVAADGRVVAFERLGVGCPSPVSCTNYYDIVVADLGDHTDAGQDVLREITRNGVSRDPSVTSDGKLLAFRNTADGNQRIQVVTTNGEPVFTVTDFTPTIQNLEIGPSGDYLVWKRIDGRSPGIIRYDVQLRFWHRVDGVNTGLSDNNPMDNAGFIYYVRFTSTSYTIVKSSGFVTTIVVPSTRDKLSEVSVSPNGETMAYTRCLASGVCQLRTVDLSRNPFVDSLLVSDGVRQTTFSNVSVNRFGDRIAYASNGNFASPARNNDGSREVYTVSRLGGASIQYTDFVAPNPPQLAEHGVAGIAVTEDSRVWFADASCAPTCQAIGANVVPYAVKHVSTLFPALSVNIAGPFVTPPFDVVAHPNSPCIQLGNLVQCGGLVRNGSESVRTIFTFAQFEFDDGFGNRSLDSAFVEPWPTILNLDAQVARIATGRNPFAVTQGTFRLFATDTQNVGPDRVVLEIPFRF